MIPRNLLDRLHKAVQTGEVYLAPPDALPEHERTAARAVATTLREEGAEAARAMTAALFEGGALGPVARVSALHVIAASPEVRDFAEAYRLAELQEFLALERDGPHLLAQLASADRHRGVVAFLMGRHPVALDWFSRAFERERTSENLGNVLATLLATGARAEAHELLATVRATFPTGIASGLEERIRADDDLRDLREA